MSRLAPGALRALAEAGRRAAGFEAAWRFSPAVRCRHGRPIRIGARYLRRGHRGA